MGGNDPIEPSGGKETGGIPGRDIWPVRAGRLARLGKAAGGARSEPILLTLEAVDWGGITWIVGLPALIFI